MKTKLPTSSKAWLEDIAKAYLDALDALPFGQLTGEPFSESQLFHLAPHVCIKFRKIRRTEDKVKEIVEGTLASYIATTESGLGAEDLNNSPLLSFTFCYLAAHFVAGLLEPETVEGLMDMCVERRDELADLVGG